LIKKKLRELLKRLKKPQVLPQSQKKQFQLNKKILSPNFKNSKIYENNKEF